MNDSTYNGWTNYETWAAKLWLDNEEHTYLEVTEHANQVYADLVDLNNGEQLNDLQVQEIAQPKYDLAGWLKDYVEEMMPDLEASLASDLLNAALSEVNWYEMAESYLGEARENAS